MASKKKSRTVRLWPVMTSWALAILCLAIYVIGNQLDRMSLFGEESNVDERLEFFGDFAWLMVFIAVVLSVLAIIAGIAKVTEYVANAVDNLRSLRSGPDATGSDVDPNQRKHSAQ